MHGVSPGDWIIQPLVFCPANIETLLHVEGNTICHFFKVSAELAQYVTGTRVLFVYQAKVDAASGLVSVERNRERIEEIIISVTRIPY